MKFRLFEAEVDRCYEEHGIPLGRSREFFYGMAVASVVVKLYRKNPSSPGTAAFVVAMYLSKLFKHRPEVAKACERNIMSSPKFVRSDMAFYNKMARSKRRMRLCRR